MNNPLLQTLQILHVLSRGPTSLKILSDQLGIAPATVKRYLAEARDLGAVVVSARLGSAWVYEVRNWPAIKVRTLLWIDLEQARTLVAVH